MTPLPLIKEYPLMSLTMLMERDITIMNEKISVIVPVYNVEKYLSRCIDSILHQKDVDFELILVDDGSTDQSSVLCDCYQKDDRVRVFHQENGGVSRARNTGIGYAKGDYLLFVDSDDWLAENALSKMIRYSDHSDMVICGSYNATEVSENIFNFTKGVYWPGHTEPYAVKDKYFEIFNKNVTLWNKLIRRSVIADIRFDEYMTYGEDCDFLCRTLDHVQKAIIVPEPLYYYFHNRKGNVVSSKIDKRSVELLENSKRIYDYLALRGQAPSGIRRIFNSVCEVQNKIPLTVADIRENRYYIQQAREALRYPPFRNRLSFYFERRIPRKIRITYIRLLLNPFHMYYRLIRVQLKRMIWCKLWQQTLKLCASENPIRYWNRSTDNSTENLP